MNDSENPESPQPATEETYHHVTVVAPGWLAYLPGQCPIDENAQLVGSGDLTTQLDKVVSNSVAALANVDVEPAHVVKSVLYVRSNDSAEISKVWNRLVESDLAEAFLSASSVVGVTVLGYPGQLVQLDLTARLPD